VNKPSFVIAFPFLEPEKKPDTDFLRFCSNVVQVGRFLAGARFSSVLALAGQHLQDLRNKLVDEHIGNPQEKVEGIRKDVDKFNGKEGGSLVSLAL